MPNQDDEIGKVMVDTLRRIRDAGRAAGDQELVDAAEAELRARGASAEPRREEGPRDAK